MAKAIFFSIFIIFAFLGMHKAIELVQSIFTLHLKNNVVIMYKIPKDSADAEMHVRELAQYSKCVCSPSKTAVYIVTDGLDKKVLELCERTAEQYNNVFTGEYEKASRLL